MAEENSQSEVVGNTDINTPKKKSFKKFLLIGLFIFALLILSGVLFILKTQRLNHVGNSAEVAKPIKAVNYFSVVSVSPENSSVDNAEDTPIKITFSEPVKPSSLKSFFTESPMIPGDFTQGATPNEVVFKARYTYGEGTSVRVILNKGFESVAGHKFTTDYTYNFFTKVADDSVIFGNSDVNSRWLNLPVGKGTTFKLQVGNSVSGDTTVTVYKGTFDKIVSSLLYSNETHTDTNYVSQSYINYPVDTSKMQQVSVLKNIQNGTKFDFKEGEGLYYVEAKSGDNVLGSTWVSVNDEGLIVRQDDQKVTIATQNIKTGDINSKVKVYLYNLEDKPTLLDVVEIQGYGEVPIVYPQKVDLVVGETENGVVLAPLTVPETQADIRVNSNLSNLDKIYVQTDKPTYKTDETVKFSGILRQDNDAKYSLPKAGSKVHVWVPDPSDYTKKIIEQTVDATGSGMFSGQFVIPQNIIPSGSNVFSTTLYAKEESDSALYVTSKAFTTFDVVPGNSSAIISVGFDKQSYTPDEDVTAHVVATDESGKPMANKSINYTVYTKDYYENDPESVADFGSDWGEQSKIVDKTATLDGNGKADIKIDQQGETVSQAVTLEASVDNNGSKIYGAKTILVQQGKIILTFGSSREEYHSGDTTITRVYAKDLSGNPVANLDLNYELYKSVYDQPSNTYNETVLYKGTVTTDSNGFALITQPVTTDPYSLTMRVVAIDSSGNFINAERQINILRNDVNFSNIYYHGLILTNLDVATDKLSYNVSDTANLVINSPFDREVLVTYESGRIYHNEWLKLSKGDNKYSVKITPELFPSFNIVFSYFNNSILYEEGVPITVNDPSKNITITTSTDKTIYAKNDQAQLTIKTTDISGQPVNSNISVSVVDDNIFNLRSIIPAGPIYWNFYSPRIDMTNFSASTLGIGTGGGCGGGGGSDINYVPNRTGTTYYWNPDLTTDQNGEVKIAVPVGNTSGKLHIFITATSDDTAVGQSQPSILVQ